MNKTKLFLLFPIFITLFISTIISPLPSLAQSETGNQIQLQFGGTISETGLIEVTILNDNFKDLKLKAEYGEGDFGLKSNTFYFGEENGGYGTATLTALRKGQTYQYRLFDTEGVLEPSETYTFVTSPGSPVYISYISISPNHPNYANTSAENPLVGFSFFITQVTSTSVTFNISGLEPFKPYALGFFRDFEEEGFEHQIEVDKNGKSDVSFTDLVPNTSYTVFLLKYDSQTGDLINFGSHGIRFLTLSDDFSVSNITTTSADLLATGLTPGKTYQFKTNTFSGSVTTNVKADSEGIASGSFVDLTPSTIYTVNLFSYDTKTKETGSTGTQTLKFQTLASSSSRRTPVVSIGTITTPLPPPRSTPSSSSESSFDGRLTADCGKKTVGGEFRECGLSDFIDLINKVFKFILFDLAIPIAAVMFFYAGFLMVTAGGESSSARTKAKKIFTNTVIGLVFVAGAWIIINTILSILGYADGSWFGF